MGLSLPSVYMEFPWEGRAGFCPCFFRALVNGISLFTVERENVQKRTFTRWINLHLEKASGVWGLVSDTVTYIHMQLHGWFLYGGREET